MRTYRLIIWVILLGCKTAAPPSTGTYSEDLSIHRPVSTKKVEETTAIEVVEEKYTPLQGHIKSELDSIAKVAYAQNKEGRLVDGFVIQVYSGTNRNEANDSRYKMESLFPELHPRVSYHQPSFRVKAGKFIDRLEAHRVYRQVKAEFPRALLIPERFLLTYE